MDNCAGARIKTMQETQGIQGIQDARDAQGMQGTRGTRGIQGIQGILFDLDGTLLDTTDLILGSMRYATQKVLGHVIPDEDFLKTMGLPLETQMRDFIQDEDLIAEVCRVYREHNARTTDEAICIYEGIPEMLALLHEKGFRLGVVTSKRPDIARQGLRAFDLEPFFECLVGSTDCLIHKPEPDPVLVGCQRLGLEPAACAYVGDAPYDILAGNAAGCLTVAVTWGVHGEETLRTAEPTYVVSAPSELCRLFL